MRVLVTGGAGFIGSHVAERLLARGDAVICVDNFNDFYDPGRKRRNVAAALDHAGYTLVEADIRDAEVMARVFAAHSPSHVVHIAALANPRMSMARPLEYEDVNVRGTIRLLELARAHGSGSFLFASTSSVYGRSPTPWSETTPTDRPLSPYAATKKAAELFASMFASTHGLRVRVVRFFTVYGPRGRPDMTPHLFVDRMVRGEPITLYEGGVGVFRDWTFIDEIVDGVLAALGDAGPDFDTFNLGNSGPIELREFVRVLEDVTGLRAAIDVRPLAASDPPITFADVRHARERLGFAPRTPLAQGLARFWDWYRAESDV